MPVQGPRATHLPSADQGCHPYPENELLQGIAGEGPCGQVKTQAKAALSESLLPVLLQRLLLGCKFSSFTPSTLTGDCECPSSTSPVPTTPT